MTVITPVRIATVLGTVALLAGTLATTAAAGPPVRSPDTQDAAAQSGELDPAIATAIAAHRTSVTAADNRSSALKPREKQTSGTSTNAVSGYGPSGGGPGAGVPGSTTGLTAPGLVDTTDAAAQSGELDPAIATAIAAHRTSVTAADNRSSDTKDATGVHVAPTTTPQVSVVASDSVFDWTDAAIGAVAGFAIALLLGGMILLSTRGRHGSLAL